jgi:hypothetical protein
MPQRDVIFVSAEVGTVWAWQAADMRRQNFAAAASLHPGAPLQHCHQIAWAVFTGRARLNLQGIDLRIDYLLEMPMP